MLAVTNKRNLLIRIATIGVIASVLTFAGISHSAAVESPSTRSTAEPPAKQKMVRDGVAVEFRVIPDETRDLELYRMKPGTW